MDKANVLLALTFVLMCSALVPVQSGWFSSYKHVNFDGLDKWLVKGLAKDEDVKANMNFIRSNLGQLGDQKVRRAAEVVVAMEEATECNEQLMGYLKEAAADRAILKGRLEKIAKPAMERVAGLCGAFVDSKVADVYASSLASSPLLNKFVEVVAMKNYGWKLPFGSEPARKPGDGYCWEAGTWDDEIWKPNQPLWAQHLYDLSRSDPRARVNKQVAAVLSGGQRMLTATNHDAFKYALDKYLVQPCKLLTSSLGDTFEAVHGLTGLLCSKGNKCVWEFVLKRSNTAMPLMFAYKTCKSLQTNGYFENIEMFRLLSDYENSVAKKERFQPVLEAMRASRTIDIKTIAKYLR